MASKKNGSIHRNELLAKLVTGNKVPCVFCQRKVDDEVIYGKLYAIGDIQCHYFCVLLSSCLVQRGRDEEGLFGFLYHSIVAEVERSKKHKCSFCGRMGATLGCSISQCKKQFHLPCGRERQAVSLFYGNYKSFCNQHAPKQSLPENIMVNAKLRMNINRKKNVKSHSNFSNLKELSQITGDDTQTIEKESVCVICYEEVDGFPTLQTFWPPCCARDAWFHRSCLQRMALSAGMHYLKCPLCNDKDNFYQAVISQGYYVPDRDAAWELEQNAFAEIYERPISCDAEECKCPMGRSHDADTGAWDLKLCILCGSSGLHLGCCEDGATRHVCRVCQPAAPHDIDLLADSIQQVILAEQSQAARAVRRGPIMPSRMSLRRTKQRISALNIASSSSLQYVAVTPNETSDLHSSRQDLNLKTPRRMLGTIEYTSPLKSIENKSTPIKLFQQGLYDKIQTMGLKSIELNSHVLEVVQRKFQKPKPLCVKKRIVNDLLDGLIGNLLKDHKKKERLKEWHSPVKCSNNELVSEEPLQHIVEESTESLDVHSTSPKVSPQKKQDLDKSNIEFITKLPESKVEQESSDKCLKISEELQIFDTPKKLKTVDIEKNSSLEISANDEVINIDVIKMENGQTGEQQLLSNTPVKPNKCAFKFSPSDKEKLKRSNIDMDLESFKNQYLNEVDRYKCSFNHNHTDANESKLCTAIDFVVDPTSQKEKGAVKRKLDVEKRSNKKRKVDVNSRKKLKRKEKRKKNKNKDNITFTMASTQKENKIKNKLKTKLSIRNKNIQLKIKWKEEELNLKISKSKRIKKRKMDNKLKQCLLQYYNDIPSTDVLVMPEKDVTPLKRKYVRQEIAPDNLKQTSIQNFFKVMTPKV